MAKICFPHYKKGEFASLADALKFMERETYSISRYALCEIVRYNICYRNHLRRHGVEDLIIRLIEEAPRLKEEMVLLHRLREWATEKKLPNDANLEDIVPYAVVTLFHARQQFYEQLKKA